MSKIIHSILRFTLSVIALSTLFSSSLETEALTIDSSTSKHVSRFANCCHYSRHHAPTIKPKICHDRPAINVFRSSFSDRRRGNTLKMSDLLDAPTIEKTDEKTTKKSSDKQDERVSSGGWDVRLYNDPYNKREFVAMCLSTVCGKSDTESYQIMMQAHNNGLGVIGRYMFEVAELYLSSLKENGLLVDMVEADE